MRRSGPVAVAIGKLRMAREARALTQAEVAASATELGARLSAIGYRKLESGSIANPTLATVAAVFEVLGIPLKHPLLKRRKGGVS